MTDALTFPFWVKVWFSLVSLSASGAVYGLSPNPRREFVGRWCYRAFNTLMLGGALFIVWVKL